jgi:hypothetical protein
MVKLTGCVESLKSTPTVPGRVAFTGRTEIVAKSCIDIPEGRVCNMTIKYLSSIKIATLSDYDALNLINQNSIFTIFITVSLFGIKRVLCKPTDK